MLVAPLNWGLGHATRCIPIIEALLINNAEVILASDGLAYQLLQKEFPKLPIFQLPSYNVSYRYSSMVRNMLPQLPKIWFAIRRENKVVEQIVRDENIDIIISDNRYGCYHSDTVNIFLTHQVFIKSGSALGDFIIRHINHRLIKRFEYLWIPDFSESPGLAGELSHGRIQMIHQYIGPLSRLTPGESINRYDIVVVLSGPEPQRTKLERAIIKQAEKIDRQFLIVQGLTDREQENRQGNIKKIAYLNAEQLNDVLTACRVIISRSGYSTIMDLLKLQKSAILIPTPGQTEQEYLATCLHEQRICYSQKQNELNISIALDAVDTLGDWPYKKTDDEVLMATVKNLLAKT